MKLNGEIKKQSLTSSYDKEGEPQEVIQLIVNVDAKSKVSLDEIRKHVAIPLVFEIIPAQAKMKGT